MAQHLHPGPETRHGTQAGCGRSPELDAEAPGDLQIHVKDKGRRLQTDSGLPGQGAQEEARASHGEGHAGQAERRPEPVPVGFTRSSNRPQPPRAEPPLPALTTLGARVPGGQYWHWPLSHPGARHPQTLQTSRPPRAAPAPAGDSSLARYLLGHPSVKLVEEVLELVR